MPYDAQWDCQKIKIEWCHSLPVDYGTRLLITKWSITHKLLSWDNTYIRSMLVQCHLPTNINNIRSCHPMVTTNLCFTQLFIGHLKHDWCCFHVKALECYSPPDKPFCKIYHSIWRPPTSLSIYCCLIPYTHVQFDKMHTQKCGNFEKTMTMTSFHVQFLCFRTCLNNVNVSIVSDILSVTLPKVQIQHKGQDYSSVLKQTAVVCCHHLLHQQFVELIQHNSSLVNPCLWSTITPMFSWRNPHHSHLPIAHMLWEDVCHPKL